MHEHDIPLCNDQGLEILPPESGIPMKMLMERLHLSRSYVTKNITHVVRHVEKYRSKGKAVVFDRKELQNWLLKHATFTRQTIRLDVAHFADEKLQAEICHKLCSPQYVPPDPYKRSSIIPITVPSFDFWNKKLFFPKHYTRWDRDFPHGHDDYRTASHEKYASPHENELINSSICYRDMFIAGAIKIQLGAQKTMFYVPDIDKHTSIADFVNPKMISSSSLAPMSLLTPHINNVSPATHDSTFKMTIEVNDLRIDSALIEKAVRKGFLIDKITGVHTDRETRKTFMTLNVRIQSNRK